MNRLMPGEFARAQISDNAKILCEHATIGDGAVIGPDVTIEAREVHIGAGTIIERGTTIKGLGKPCARLWVGDQSFVGFANQILVPDFVMGDYAQLHNSSLTSGYQPIRIGHNCWIGQQSILNCTETLTLGNNVRVGTGSHIWTHVASGELLEGCTLYGEHPVTVEDDVWIVGGAVISPGLTLGRRAVIMTGAVLTKSAEAGHTYAGVPAKDVTDKLNFWKTPTLGDKIEMMKDFIQEYNSAAAGAPVIWVDDPAEVSFDDQHLYVVGELADWDGVRSRNISLFDLASKRYHKTGRRNEVAFVRWMVGFRARVLPVNDALPARFND